MKCPVNECTYQVTDSNQLANSYFNRHLQSVHRGINSLSDAEKKTYQEQKAEVRRELTKSVAVCFHNSMDDDAECQLCHQDVQKVNQRSHVAKCHEEATMKCPVTACTYQVTDSNQLANGYIGTHLSIIHRGINSLSDAEKEAYQEQRVEVGRELNKSVAVCFPDSSDVTPAKKRKRA